MLKSRMSGSAENRDLDELVPHKNETNVAWLERAGREEGLVLLGGTSLSHFRVRVAQCHLRRDLLPSFWSLAGILHKGRVLTVSLDHVPAAREMVMQNAVVALPLAKFSDPEAFPNIAVLSFPGAEGAPHVHAKTVGASRLIVDLPSLVVRWLAFVWSTSAASNPLLETCGVPSAAFVEAVYGLARVDITPGLASAAGCPEAIWQAAKWWRSYYERSAGEGASGVSTPSGVYALRQIAAAALG